VTFGLTSEETLWTALGSWAKFQPRKDKPRTNAGHLFYPDESSNVFEKYWNHLGCLDQPLEFESELEYTRYCMTLFSQGLSGKGACPIRYARMYGEANHPSGARPSKCVISIILSGIASQGSFRPSAEAEEGDVLIADNATISRLRQVHDGPDCWEEHRSSADTGLGGPAPN
jgi:hypothetical protein